MDGLDPVCWDTCIFYAVLKGEDHGNGELAVLQEYARQFNQGARDIVASTLVLAEVRQSKLSSDEFDEFLSMSRRSSFTWVDVTPSIATLAGELRELKTPAGKYLQPADAIHVATAIKMNVDLWTMDQNDKSSAAGILPLADLLEESKGLSVRRPNGQAGIPE